MKIKSHLVFLGLSLMANLHIVNAQEMCNDVAGNVVNCSTVINQATRYLRDISVNSDSVSVGDSAFTPETVLKFNNSEIKSGVEGNVANQPIVFRGCGIPTLEDFAWEVNDKTCRGENYHINNIKQSLLRLGASEFEHGYTVTISDTTSSNNPAIKDYNKGQAALRCNNGKWEIAQDLYKTCDSGYCSPFLSGYTKFDNTWPCIMRRVQNPDDKVGYLFNLESGQSSWFINYNIGQFNHNGRLFATCDRGTIVHNEPDICTPRNCSARPVSWQVMEGPNGNPNFGKSDYAYYSRVAIGDSFYIPDSYAPLNNWFHKCQADFPDMQHGQTLRLNDKTNPSNYNEVQCVAGIMQSINNNCTN